MMSSIGKKGVAEVKDVGNVVMWIRRSELWRWRLLSLNRSLGSQELVCMDVRIDRWDSLRDDYEEKDSERIQITMQIIAPLLEL